MVSRMEQGANEPMVGRLLGETYRLVRLMGEGGMGAVYEAKHTRLDKRFAVKMLRDGLTMDRDGLVMGSVRHPVTAGRSPGMVPPASARAAATSTCRRSFKSPMEELDGKMRFCLRISEGDREGISEELRGVFGPEHFSTEQPLDSLGDDAGALQFPVSG